MLPNTLEYMTKIGIDGFKLPWAILENKKASELTSLTDIANALHEDYLFNLNRWNTFVDSLTGLYNDGKKTITDIEQIVSDLQNLIVKIQTDISEAQTELTSAISDNIKQLNEFIEASKATIESIKTVIGIASHII
jgi:peptidoglycan hydrolase CwlO-like protein